MREPLWLFHHSASKTLVCGSSFWNYPTTERPLGVWLPGLKRVSKLLNGTAGVRRVASSKVHKKLMVARDGDGEAIIEGPPVVGGVGIDRLVIRIDGTGNYGAHRLVATYENDRGLRTQQLFVSCEPSFSLGELRDVLRALQPVLNFVLDDGAGKDEIPF